ncbi:MAG: 50S ribosomal protein L22 [Acidobacteriota bacterium]
MYTARLRHLQASPQKVRLVADLIRGRQVQDAVNILDLSTKHAARPMAKLLKSAIANAEDRNDNVDVDELFIKEISVDGGPALKRVWFTTMGRAYRKLKRQSHITIKLDVRADDETDERS